MASEKFIDTEFYVVSCRSRSKTPDTLSWNSRMLVTVPYFGTRKWFYLPPLLPLRLCSISPFIHYLPYVLLPLIAFSDGFPSGEKPCTDSCEWS